jgi:hypothetical protein
LIRISPYFIYRFISITLRQGSDHNDIKKPLEETHFLRRANTRPTYAVLSLTEVYHLNSWSFKADNHLKDSVFFLLLTSSRIDLIRTSQNLACLILFCMSFKYFEILFFLPPSKMIELSFILNLWMFLLMSMGISIIKDLSFHHLIQYIHCS